MAAKKQLNWLLFRLHTVFGVGAGLVLLIIFLTGAIIVFGDEILALEYPGLMQVEPQDKPLISLDTAYARVRAAYPEALPFGIRHIPQAPGETMEFGLLGNTEKNYFYAFLDPYDGRVLGDAKQGGVFHFLLKVHYSMGAGKVGELIAGIAAVLLLGSCLTGVLVYRHSLLGALLFRVKLRKKSARARWSAWHRLVGVWTLFFLLILGSSGVLLMSYTFKLGSHFSKAEELAAERAQPYGYSIEGKLTEARQAIDGFQASYVSFPRKGGEPLEIWGFTPGHTLEGDWSAEVVFDARSGELIRAESEEGKGFWHRTESVLHTLHYGQYGGWPIKVLVCLFGLFSCLVVVSGFGNWWLRRRKHKAPLASTNYEQPHERPKRVRGPLVKAKS